MVNKLTFYLKYRPQTLEELIGQEVVKKTLLASFRNNKLSHAYLFVGPRGTGKTSTARILAKIVNCSDKESRPCNKCSNCISITDGSNLDLIEIDAASNRGIEDIRSLRDKIKLAPTNAQKKVYIIDEVHMLTTEAFNALLKTLEEPPAHVLFILATTEGSKIPQTILSRVQRLDFKLATTEELLEALKRIAKEEKIDTDDEALKAVAKKSDGSFRDGVKLLDQLSSLGEKITEDLIEQNLKGGGFENILGLLQILKNKNAKEALLNITKQLENGDSAKDLILSLMDNFRYLVFIKTEVGEKLVKGNLNEDKYQSLVKIAGDFTMGELIQNLEILQDSLERLKFTSMPSLPLELAVVKMCDENFPPKADRPLDEKSINQNWKPETGQVVKSEPVKVISEVKASKEDDILRTEEVVSSIKSEESCDNADIIKLKEKWTFVLETVRPYNFSLEALLRSINITSCTDTRVYIEVPYSFHQRILEAPKNKDLLDGILSDVLGRSVRISVSLGVRPQRREDVANIEIAADDEIIRAAAEIFNSDTVN